MPGACQRARPPYLSLRPLEGGGPRRGFAIFFDRRPLSRRHAGPLYLSCAEQRDGEHRDIAPGAGPPPIATENPKPIRREKPRRLPRRPIVRPLGRSPAPPENPARGQLAPSPPRPDRFPLRSIRPKTAPVDSPVREENPGWPLRSGRLSGRSAASAHCAAAAPLGRPRDWNSVRFG